MSIGTKGVSNGVHYIAPSLSRKRPTRHRSLETHTKGEASTPLVPLAQKEQAMVSTILYLLLYTVETPTWHKKSEQMCPQYRTINLMGVWNI
jgi:hypothetical protein